MRAACPDRPAARTLFDSLAGVISAGPTGAVRPRLLWIVVATLAVAMLGGAAELAAAARPGLGPPDVPPSAPTVSVPVPTPPPSPSPATPTPAAPAASGATPSAPSADPSAAAAAATAARRAARAARARRSAAVTRAGDGVQNHLRAASGTLSRVDATARRALEDARAGAVTGGGGRESTLALLLLALSGFTAGVALLPFRSVRMGGHRPALSFVERHRLELAGISTSCLLVALLVFAGLI